MTRTLVVRRETWPIAGGFTISRGTKTHADVIVAEISQDGFTGRGECVPYARYAESPDSVAAQISAVAPAIRSGLDRSGLQDAMPAGAARNALDCALWDLDAKTAGVRAWDLAGIGPMKPLTTAFTISLGTPEAMAEAARAAAGRPLIKVKLGGANDAARIAAVRAAAPRARLIVDANEAWSQGDVEPFMDACAGAGVDLIEQPLPAGDDAMLGTIPHRVAICADESVHTADGLGALAGRYDAVNIKLDKTGGLTGALSLADAAARHGMDIMVGCMLATSLAMAPALLVAQRARFVDLDGPLLLAKDRAPGLRYEGSRIAPPDAALWG